jgi:hypothetical protein
LILVEPDIKRDQPKLSLNNRLLLYATRLIAEAESLPDGPERDALIRKARQTETAAHFDEWLSSPGVQAPR